MSKEKIWELIAKKLAGEASLSELKELEDMMRKEPDMHYPLQTISDLWHHKPIDEEDPYEAFDRHMARLGQMGIAFGEVARNKEESFEELFGNNQPPPLKKRILRYSLITLLVGFILFAGYHFSFPSKSPTIELAQVIPNADKSEVSTKYGSKTKLVLPDGTQVWLNSGSRLTYDKNYGNSLREVVLSGEAYFDVVKNPNLPFVIHASKINIKVLGTAFNVRSYPEEKNIETSLVRGSIEVTFRDRPSEKIILKPNEKLVIANEEVIPNVARAPKSITGPGSIMPEPIVAISHLTYQPQDSTVVETSWMEGKLIFRSESFEELSVRMERWFGISIRFANNEFKDKKFTGIFENESIEQALTALQLTADFKYTINKKEVYITR
jgi:transmembrane sensor